MEMIGCGSNDFQTRDIGTGCGRNDFPTEGMRFPFITLKN